MPVFQSMSLSENHSMLTITMNDLFIIVNKTKAAVHFNNCPTVKVI